MPVSSMIVKLLTLSLLSIGWLSLHHTARRLNPNQPYHLSAYKRDERKARFYYGSIWAGIVAAFLSLSLSEALAKSTFESNMVRDWVMGITYGVGIWGMIIVGMVWSQVGKRVSQPNSDGRSLTPLPNEDTFKR